MRRLLLTAVVFGAVSGATAADMPDYLRGSIPARAGHPKLGRLVTSAGRPAIRRSKRFQQERRRSDEFYFS